MPNLNKTSWAFSSVTIKSISILLVNKFFAVYLGPVGIALLSHFQNLIGIITQLINDGFNRGMMKQLANNSMDPKLKSRFFFSSLILNFSFLILILLLVILFQDFFFGIFFEKINNPRFLPVFIFLLSFFVANMFIHSVILGFQKAKEYAFINITGAILYVSLVFLGVKTEKLSWALLAVLAGQSLSIFFSIFFLLKERVWIKFQPSVSWQSLKKLFVFVPVSLSVLVFYKMTDFAVRQFAFHEYGFEMTGMWQAVVRLSDVYMNLFVATVGVVFYPQVSELIFDSDKLRRYLKDVLHIVIPISAVGLVVLYLLREPVLTILYDKGFADASFLMRYQLTGDFFGIICYLLTYIISAQSKTTTFIILQAGSAIFYIGLIYFLKDYFGIISIPMSHALRFFFFFVILLILNRRMIF